MGLHWYDLLGLVVLGLIVFGPKKLPEMGSSLGKTIREFQKSMREVTNPEPPASAIPPSATQAAQPFAPAPPTAPEITQAAPATTPVMAASQATVTGQIVDDEVGPRVEEDSVR